MPDRPADAGDYPAHLLPRAPAPPYDGEGPFALWHFSEDPSLRRFLPRPPQTTGLPQAAGLPQTLGASPSLIWAVDTRHAPMFWFPRDCPRGCIWPGPGTTPQDRMRFFGLSASPRVHVMESGWLDRMRECRLYAYRLPTVAFKPHDVGGYWVAREPVDALDRVVIDDLLGRHATAGIELRITPSLWPFWDQVAASTVTYSGIRLRNSSRAPAGPRPGPASR